MNRISVKRKFNPDAPVYARRSVVIHGEIINVRQQIPWRELGVKLSTMLMWFRLRRVSHNPAGDQRHRVKMAHHGKTDAVGNRLDGPTIEVYVDAGYLPEWYPPRGYAALPSPGYSQFVGDGTGPWNEVAVQQRRDEAKATSARFDHSDLVPPSVEPRDLTAFVEDLRVPDPLPLPEEDGAEDLMDPPSDDPVVSPEELREFMELEDEVVDDSATPDAPVEETAASTSAPKGRSRGKKRG